MAWPLLLPLACPRAALTVVATSSDDVLSAKRPAASWAFAAGWVVLSSFTEYLGSTKAKSAGFSGVSAAAAAGLSAVAGTVVAGAGVAGAGVVGAGVVATGADVSATLRSGLAASAVEAMDFAVGARERCATAEVRISRA